MICDHQMSPPTDVALFLHQVLMQGCLLTQKNVDRMLRVIGDALAKFENKVAQALKEVIESDTYQVGTISSS